MEIERIGPDQWQRFREVRLESLRDSPAAFGSRYDDWSEADEERWRARLVAVPLTLLARDGDRVVGVACGSPQGEDAVELLSMWVAPDSRGTGVADALVAAVVEWAADQGRTTHLMVRSDNARARTAYERAGFVDAGVPEGWPTDQPQERRMERRDGDRAGRRP